MFPLFNPQIGAQQVFECILIWFIIQKQNGYKFQKFLKSQLKTTDSPNSFLSMINNHNQPPFPSSNPKLSEFQLKKNHQLNNHKNDQKFMSPKKQSHSRIFVQTPQALYIPINEKSQEMINDFDRHMSPKEEQEKPKKISIFNQNMIGNLKQNRQTSSLSAINFQKANNSSNVIKSKASIQLKKERVSEFFYYQSFIVCKGLRKVIVYNFINKSLVHIPVNYDQFILTPFPPYVFNCITGQYLNLYSESSVQKYGELRRRRQNELKKQKLLRQCQQEKPSLAQDFKNNKENDFLTGIEIVVIKISKLEVECICRYGQLFYMGGFNRSILPGGKRSERREIYLMDHLDPKINNKPKEVIKIEPSNFPVSSIQVQMPYLVVYCRPKFYIFGLKSHELLLTFQKQVKNNLLLEGRWAINVINGIGISSRNNRSTIFTFDVESTPIYGVQITQHKQEATCLCLQKTGRIFGCNRNALFQYIPTKRITRCVKLYSESDVILWIQSTPNNNLLVLRQRDNLEYVIEAFSIDENTIGDF